MLATKITTHVADAQARLLAQYQGAPRLNALVAAVCSGTQDLENALFDLDGGRQLATAQGTQLDAIGSLLGFGRSGLEDAAYRVLLRGTIAQQNSDTSTPTVETIAALLYQAPAVHLTTLNSPNHARVRAPACLGLAVGSPGTAASLFTTVRGMLQGALAAGVALAYVVQFNAAGACSTAGPQAWVGGLGDALDPSQGAPLASVIYSNPSQ